MFLNRKPRRGGSLVEFAIVSSIVILGLVAVLIGCIDMFRYQQVTALARETARYTSLHAAQYRDGTLTDAQVYEKVIVPRAILLRLDRFTYSITWADPSKGLSYLDPATNQYVPNSVTVTITYEVNSGPKDLVLWRRPQSSTSTATVSN